ncbi:hypothetical protein ACVIHC_005882 [Bradyrhizobium diazoefficiens]
MENAKPKTSDEFKDHYALIVAGGERTRGILYFFTLLALICVITAANNYFDTAGRRLFVLNAAVACAQNFHQPSDDVPLPNLKPETDAERKCEFYYSYVEAFYRIKTGRLWTPAPQSGQTLAQLEKDQRNEQLAALLEKRTVILKQFDDNDFISVPILNFKVDGNFEVQLQSLVASLVLFVLALSISAEKKALRAASPAIVERWQRQIVVNSHVFLRPSRLNIVLWLFLFLPFVTEFAEAARDWDKHEDVLEKLYPGFAGKLFYAFEGFSLLICFALAVTCFVLAYQLRSALKVFHTVPVENGGIA